MNWHKLQFDDDGFAGNLDEQFVKPIRHSRRRRSTWEL